MRERERMSATGWKAGERHLATTCLDLPFSLSRSCVLYVCVRTTTSPMLKLPSFLRLCTCLYLHLYIHTYMYACVLSCPSLSLTLAPLVSSSLASIRHFVHVCECTLSERIYLHTSLSIVLDHRHRCVIAL